MKKVIIEDGSPQAKKFAAYIKQFLTAGSIALVIALSACGTKNEPESKTPSIIFTTTNSNMNIRLAGSGEAVIDWGEGSKQTIALFEDYFSQSTEYIHACGRMITITGDSITHFSCNGSHVTALDVRNSLTLVFLVCGNNQLTALDVSNNPMLEWLYCSGNQLTTFDISHNPKLCYLGCYNNKLTALNLNHNPALLDLTCGDNQLTALDLSNNSLLRSVFCRNNQLLTLNVSHNNTLWQLDCAENLLDSAALEILFNTLPNRTGYEAGRIEIQGNTGLTTHDSSFYQTILYSLEINWDVYKSIVNNEK